MEAILVIVTVVLFCTIVLGMIEWTVHISGVRAHKSDYGWAGYRTFKKEFAKTEWEYDASFKGALFEKGNKYGRHETRDEIFVGRIILNGKGMIINNPISYVLCMIHVRKHIKDNGWLPKKDKSRGRVNKWY